MKKKFFKKDDSEIETILEEMHDDNGFQMSEEEREEFEERKNELFRKNFGSVRFSKITNRIHEKEQENNSSVQFNNDLINVNVLRKMISEIAKKEALIIVKTYLEEIKKDERNFR